MFNVAFDEMLLQFLDNGKDFGKRFQWSLTFKLNFCI